MSLVELKGVRKSFYGVEVLHGVDFKLEPGTVHALMGENGAGKSTMMKIIAGVHLNDGGQVFIDGNEVTIDSPAKAQELADAFEAKQPQARMQEGPQKQNELAPKDPKVPEAEQPVV